MIETRVTSLSRRIGPLFAKLAAEQTRMSMEQHKAEYRSRSMAERLSGVFSEAADTPAVPAKEYKPTHGGYPG